MADVTPKRGHLYFGEKGTFLLWVDIGLWWIPLLLSQSLHNRSYHGFEYEILHSPEIFVELMTNPFNQPLYNVNNQMD